MLEQGIVVLWYCGISVRPPLGCGGMVLYELVNFSEANRIYWAHKGL